MARVLARLCWTRIGYAPSPRVKGKTARFGAIGKPHAPTIHMPNPYRLRRTLYQALPGVSCALIVAVALMALVPLWQRLTGDRAWGELVVLAAVVPPVLVLHRRLARRAARKR